MRILIHYHLAAENQCESSFAGYKLDYNERHFEGHLEENQLMPLLPFVRSDGIVHTTRQYSKFHPSDVFGCVEVTKKAPAVKKKTDGGSPHHPNFDV